MCVCVHCMRECMLSNTVKIDHFCATKGMMTNAIQQFPLLLLIVHLSSFEWEGDIVKIVLNKDFRDC